MIIIKNLMEFKMRISNCPIYLNYFKFSDFPFMDFIFAKTNEELFFCCLLFCLKCVLNHRASKRFLFKSHCKPLIKHQNSRTFKKERFDPSEKYLSIGKIVVTRLNVDQNASCLGLYWGAGSSYFLNPWPSASRGTYVAKNTWKIDASRKTPIKFPPYPFKIFHLCSIHDRSFLQYCLKV